MAVPIPPVSDLLGLLRNVERRSLTLLVGIDGRGGSGKSTLARELERAAEGVSVVDSTLWIDAPHKVRLERGVRRGGENTRERWLDEWMPEEDRYIAAEDPASRVDLVLDSTL